MNAFIKPPDKIPLLLKLGIMISKRVTGKDLLVPKLLAWYPKVAISSAILEVACCFIWVGTRITLVYLFLLSVKINI